MPNKPKQYEIIRTSMDGQEVLGTMINKKKYYFLADLKRLYGTKFMPYLPTNPISLRIPVSGNSQTRQLVNVSDFKDGFRKYKQATKEKDESKLKWVKKDAPAKKKHIAEQLDMCFESSTAPKHTNTTEIVLSHKGKEAALVPVETLTIPKLSLDTPVTIIPTTVQASDEASILEDRWKALRSEIFNIMKNHVVHVHGGHKMKNVEKNKLFDKHGKDYYTKAYQEFDGRLAKAHNTNIEGIKKMGFNKGSKNYMNIIQEKGLLEEFKRVVISLYGLDEIPM